MKRYDKFSNCMKVDAHGRYVKYEEVSKIIKTLTKIEKQINKLREWFEEREK